MDITKKKSFNSPTKTSSLSIKNRRNTIESLPSAGSPTSKSKHSSTTPHHTHSLRSSQVLNAVSKIKSIDYSSSLDLINKRLDTIEAKIDNIISLLGASGNKKETKPDYLKRNSLQHRSSLSSTSVTKTSSTRDSDKAVLSRQATIKPKKTSTHSKQSELISSLNVATNTKKDKPTPKTSTISTATAISQKPDVKVKSPTIKTSKSTITNATATKDKDKKRTSLTSKITKERPEIKETELKRKSKALSFKDKLKNLTCVTEKPIIKHTTVKEKLISKVLDKQATEETLVPSDNKKEKKSKKVNTMKGKFSAFAAELDGSLAVTGSSTKGSFKGSEELSISCDTSKELNSSLEHKSLERPMMKRGRKNTDNAGVKFISRKRM
eukprot:GAHX01000395.1.p1 GENE.GAHX01000395.1~~GAHX01000395.1.p1  ORF type:complete len:401 (-),score=79.22 GAHX01000395.1:41-1183(-)